MAKESVKSEKLVKMAVVQISGHQFLVKEGDIFNIDNQALEVGKDLEAQVLLTVDGDEVKVGRPYVEGVKVKMEVVENLKGEKIEVIKYKAKSRYRKHIGYRSHLTKVKVVSL